jgi:FkbM family methyltransferase
MSLKYTENLKECVEAHEIAVIVNDEYHIRELYQTEKNLEYIVDLGANVGTASFKLQTFYPNAKILVCEPEPECMKLAKLNTNNKLIYVEKAVIGDDRKDVTFNVCKWAGNGHVDGNFRWDLYAPMGSKLEKQITVPAITLTKLMEEYNFPRIDLLKIDTEGMESQILKEFKPNLRKVKHIRGEWHGDVEKDLIRDVLQETHDLYFESELKTNGGFFAELKTDLDEPKKIKENVKRGIVITTSEYTKEFLKDCLDSIKDVEYPVLVVSNGDYKPDHYICQNVCEVIINEENLWEMGGIQRGKENFDEFVHLMDTTVVKDISMFDRLFEIDGNVVLTKGNFHYMGKFETAKLPNLPVITNKDTAIKLEAHWLKYYKEFRPDLPVQSDVFEEVHGQRRMRLENRFMVKWKGTFQRDVENEDKWF